MDTKSLEDFVTRGMQAQRAVDELVQTLEWSCNRCGESGRVGCLVSDGPEERWVRVREAHAIASPACQGDGGIAVKV